MCISESPLLYGQSSGEGVCRYGSRLSAARFNAAVSVDLRLADSKLHNPQLCQCRRLVVALLNLVVGDRDVDLSHRSTHHTHRQHPRHA